MALGGSGSGRMRNHRRPPPDPHPLTEYSRLLSIRRTRKELEVAVMQTGSSPTQWRFNAEPWLYLYAKRLELSFQLGMSIHCSGVDSLVAIQNTL